MPDPNPARGMPIQFKKYYLARRRCRHHPLEYPRGLRPVRQADQREGH